MLRERLYSLRRLNGVLPFEDELRCDRLTMGVSVWLRDRLVMGVIVCGCVMVGDGGRCVAVWSVGDGDQSSVGTIVLSASPQWGAALRG